MPHKSRMVFAVALLALLAAAVAGCGSSSESSSSGKKASAAELKPFEERMQEGFANLELSKFPGPTTPATPPKGIKLAVVMCDATLGGCRIPAEGAVEAAKRLGWSATLLNGQGESQRFNLLMKNAVAQDVDAIIADGINPSLASQGLADAREHGIATISLSEGTPPSEKGFNIDISGDTRKIGEILGSYIVVESKGTAHVLPMADNEYSTAKHANEGVSKVLEQCQGCDVEPTFDFIASDISTTLQGRLISYLRSHQGIDWIYAPYDPSVTGAICPALQRAGLSEQIHVVSFLGLKPNMKMVQEGGCQSADSTWPQKWNGWAGVDQLIRILDEEPTISPPDEGMPIVLVDKEHIPASLEYEGDKVDYRSAYEKLWGLK